MRTARLLELEKIFFLPSKSLKKWPKAAKINGL